MSQILTSMADLNRRVRVMDWTSASSVEGIAPEADSPPDTGSREGVQPWACRHQAPVFVARTFGISDVVPWDPLLDPIDATMSNDLAWSRFRSALGLLRVACAGEVRGHLESHPDLFDPVESLCRTARNEFGPDAEVSLHVYRDPEVEDPYLLLLVRLREYPADTMQRLQGVVDANECGLRDRSGTVLVTTDFRQLR